MQDHKDIFVVIRVIVIVCIFSAALLIWLASAEKISLPALLSRISTKLYSFRNENIFVVNGVRNRYVFVYAYFIIIASSIVAFFMKDFLGGSHNKKKKDKALPVPLPHTAFIVGLIVFFLTAGLQLAYQINHFSGEIRTYSGKTESEKNSQIFGLPYEFAKFCNTHLPGSHRGEYISSFSREEARGLMLRYRVGYHIYPINISISTDQPVDAYVVFQKEDPHSAIPDDFKTRYNFDRFSTLAVKKSPQ
ncbi:hypothetical protein OAA99_01420 [Omnitrophica bacterium]|nr:hypothetical protein [Candidatus Omnitrophota bacterium]